MKRKVLGITGALTYSDICNHLGIGIRIDVSEGILAAAVATFLGERDSGWVSASVDYHPDYYEFGIAADIIGVRNPVPQGIPCLVVEEDAGGFKNLVSSYGLSEMKLPEKRTIPLSRENTSGWFVPGLGDLGCYGSEEFHLWLDSHRIAIPGCLAKVLTSCDLRNRGHFSRTVEWLVAVWYGVQNRDWILEVLDYLIAMDAFMTASGDCTPWGVAVGWSIRIQNSAWKERRKLNLDVTC